MFIVNGKNLIAVMTLLLTSHTHTPRHMAANGWIRCTIGTPMVKNSQKTVKTAKMTIGVPIVTGLPRLYQQCTNSVIIVKNSEKQSKDSKNSKK